MSTSYNIYDSHKKTSLIISLLLCFSVCRCQSLSFTLPPADGRITNSEVWPPPLSIYIKIIHFFPGHWMAVDTDDVVYPCVVIICRPDSAVILPAAVQSPAPRAASYYLISRCTNHRACVHTSAITTKTNCHINITPNTPTIIDLLHPLREAQKQRPICHPLSPALGQHGCS